MSDKILVYDKVTGTYFKMSTEDLMKAQNEVNQSLGISEYMSLQEYVDILNRGLPEDDQIKLGGYWFREHGFIHAIDDDFIFECVKHAGVTESGEVCVTFGVALVKKEEDPK